jgi:hypothetical protein
MRATYDCGHIVNVVTINFAEATSLLEAAMDIVSGSYYHSVGFWYSHIFLSIFGLDVDCTAQSTRHILPHPPTESNIISIYIFNNNALGA